MTFADLVAGEPIFLDANPLVYHFAPHPTLGAACTQLITRIGSRELQAVTSTYVLSETAHHLMTFEASAQFGWTTKVVQRLKQQPACVRQLANFRQAIEQVPPARHRRSDDSSRPYCHSRSHQSANRLVEQRCPDCGRYACQWSHQAGQ
jgi:predicted nucleic acid-binding protein